MSRGGLGMWACWSCALLIAAPASAQKVYINSNQVTINDMGESVAQARYRLSQTNWDQSLDRGVGTANTADFIEANLGNNTALSGKT